MSNPQTATTVPLVPAPWKLTGNGYVWLYRFPRQFGIAHSPFGLYAGGFGSVMLVDYHTTDVGPYRELLFIPGRVHYPGQTGYSISRIYVSTMDSVVNGQLNWGIPKEQADFTWETGADGGDYVRVSLAGEPFFEATLQPSGLAFPVTAAVLPPVVQYRDRQTFITRLQSSAQGRLAKSTALQVNPAHFPPVDHYRPLATLQVTGFNMVFPQPAIVPDQPEAHA